MKKLILPVLLLASAGLFAQDTDNVSTNEFNKWSIEVSGGVHKPARPMASGYFTNTPDFGQVGLGARYMVNEKFGLRLGLGYNNIEEDENSLPFESSYFRTSLEGVVNVGNILNFNSWTNTFGLLVHGGGGYSFMKYDSPVEIDDKDQMLHMVAGITPMIKLGNRVALFGDVSAIGNIRQSRTFDGTAVSHTKGVDGFLVNASVGLNIYLGKADTHADWYSEENRLTEEFMKIEDRVNKIENDLIDTDQDGVPDYLDREPNTMTGVAVDSKGRAVDVNNNGIPDEIEHSLDQRYLQKGENAQGTNAKDNSIADLLNKGYVNVYFKFNSDKPETYSLQAINYLKQYMKENSSVNAELIGYADELGNPEYNAKLSEKRAKKVYDILVASGIEASRLSYIGGGEDTSVEKSSAPARQLVRRVTFKLK
ncbi:OmpA family protein [Bizionia paragorgiae]|uniref:OmpA-OmpF porin, OOP family n=1 Tax=Bizionia paragorgiae TaxID=283786 RepID=A0A1H4AMJ0_BIZPA|nr:OmpA family protein [Bizionia paragorgiae]SEA37113.1 OmpA-OmpF porin, OOP family [Bizionia paragorgiae]